VIVACGANWVPLVLYKSGYGPREFLGDRLLVENKNVGHNMSGDTGAAGAEAYFADPIDDNIDVRGAEPYAAVYPRPWPDLSILTGKGVPYQAFPYDDAVGRDAPQYGWEHKEHMRNYAGLRRSMPISAGFGAIPRTFRWAGGPTAINAAYGWRRMIANHFTRGCSTKGFA